MNINWKKTAGAIVLVAMIAGSTGGAMAAPKKKGPKHPKDHSGAPHLIYITKEEKKPEGDAPTETLAETERTSKDQGAESGREKAPDAAEAKGETPPSTERGIKDPAVKGCGNCGVTGRVKAPGTGPRTPNNILLILGGLAAAGGIAAAASGGNDTPTSP